MSETKRQRYIWEYLEDILKELKELNKNLKNNNKKGKEEK